MLNRTNTYLFLFQLLSEHEHILSCLKGLENKIVIYDGWYEVFK